MIKRMSAESGVFLDWKSPAKSPIDWAVRAARVFDVARHIQMRRGQAQTELFGEGRSRFQRTQCSPIVVANNLDRNGFWEVVLKDECANSANGLWVQVSRSVEVVDIDSTLSEPEAFDCIPLQIRLDRSGVAAHAIDPQLQDALAYDYPEHQQQEHRSFMQWTLAALRQARIAELDNGASRLGTPITFEQFSNTV